MPEPTEKSIGHLVVTNCRSTFSPPMTVNCHQLFALASVSDTLSTLPLKYGKGMGCLAFVLSMHVRRNRCGLGTELQYMHVSRTLTWIVDRDFFSALHAFPR